ncbi:MAG: hypothetical protein IJM54_02830 [Thermoguttaceae bacterium]|nr:hypothetical protein [Thermoguttaceae bacterium]
MSKYSLPCVLGLAATLAFGSFAAFAQDEPKQPATLSSPLLMDEELAPQKMKIDPAILTPPADATADELFEFVDTLQDKLPQPTSQEELYQVVDAFSKTTMTVADKLLAMDDLTQEQRERAVQLKVVSLTTRANVDPDAAKELDAFVDDNLAKAKTDEELLKAYQLKLQVTAASEENPLEKIKAIADEAFQREQEELQIFAIEVKANVFISSVQRTGDFDASMLAFVDEVIADESRSAKVKEKAYEMKLVATIVADEIEKSKEDASDYDGSYAKQAEELFNQLLSGDFSIDLKKTVYQLRIQTLMNSAEPNDEKLEAIAEELAKQEDEELYALGVSVKGELLLKAAQEDKAAIDALVKYADKIAEEAKKSALLKTPAVGLKVQALRLQEDDKGLVDYIDEQLAAEPDEDLERNLVELKFRVAISMISKDAAAFDMFKDLCEKYGEDERFAPAIANLYSARFTGGLAQIEQNGADLEKFNAVVEQFKADLAVCPRAITALLMARQSVDAIGKANGKDDLFDETFSSIIDYCKVSDVEELNTLAQNLENYLTQMKEAQKAAEQNEADAQDDAAEENE